MNYAAREEEEFLSGRVLYGVSTGSKWKQG